MSNYYQNNVVNCERMPEMHDVDFLTDSERFTAELRILSGPECLENNERQVIGEVIVRILRRWRKNPPVVWHWKIDSCGKQKTEMIHLPPEFSTQLFCRCLQTEEHSVVSVKR